MGRRPDPAAVKIAKGNPGRRPIGEGETAEEAAFERVSPPAWLKKEGLAVWRRLAPQVVAKNLLTPLDSETFARYCHNFARWLRMQRVLDREKETYESESLHGKLKRVHPAFLIGDRVEKSLLAMEANFGLNPAERQRIFAARAAGNAGDLFGAGEKKPASGMPATPHRPANEKPIGFLHS